MLTSIGCISNSALAGKLSVQPFNTLTITATCNITYTGTLVIGFNTTTFPNTTNYYYVFIQSGTGYLYINKNVTASVLAVGAGGGGGGNNGSGGSSSTRYAGAGGGGGAYYYNAMKSINSKKPIFVSIGIGGSGGTGNSGAGVGTNGSSGTPTTIYGDDFSSPITLNGGGGGYGATTAHASVYGTGGTHTNGTGNGQNGGIGGSGGNGNVGVSIYLGDMAQAFYCTGAHGGSQILGNNPSSLGEAPVIGGGGAGGNASFSSVNGTTGGNGGIVIVLAKTV